MNTKAKTKIAIAFFGFVMLLTSALPANAADENMTSNDMMADDSMMDENMTSNDMMADDSMMDENMMDNNTSEQMMSPKMQMNEGIAPKDVQCKGGFQLLFKTSDGSAICVSSNTANVLLQRNWATQA